MVLAPVSRYVLDGVGVKITQAVQSWMALG